MTKERIGGETRMLEKGSQGLRLDKQDRIGRIKVDGKRQGANCCGDFEQRAHAAPQSYRICKGGIGREHDVYPNTPNEAPGEERMQRQLGERRHLEALRSENPRRSRRRGRIHSPYVTKLQKGGEDEGRAGTAQGNQEGGTYGWGEKL